MSLLGKILLFVNLVAAAILAYLTAQDWAKRQEVSGLALRYSMMLTGIQVESPRGIDGGDDEVPMVIETAPGYATTTVSKKLLTTHLDGQFVPSQADEVRAVKQKIDGLVANQPDDASKIRVLCGGVNQAGQFEPGFLMRFADTFEERQAIRAMALTRNPQLVAANLAEARRRLDRRFDAALNPPNPGAAQADAQKVSELQAKLAAVPPDPTAAQELTGILAQGVPGYARDDADRRTRIAQLLMLHDPAQANQTRTIKLVGLRTYARALNEQSGQMEEIVRRIERQIEQDQSKFQEEYELLKRLAVQQDQLLYQQQRVVAGLRDQASQDDNHVEVRQTQVKLLETSLDAISKSVAGLLQQQAEVEKVLYEVQRRVGETLQGNFDLEEKLLRSEESK